MEFDTVLKNRRSIRRYKDQPVEKALLDEILQAALFAPSWKNSQCHRYHVVVSPEMLKKAKEEILPPFNAKNAANAPVLIFSTVKKGLSGMGVDGYANELQEGWGLYDLGLSDENILLKAKEKGLGTLVMGIRDADKIRSILQVPEDEIIVAAIALGYPDIEPEMKNRKGLDEICTYY